MSYNLSVRQMIFSQSEQARGNLFPLLVAQKNVKFLYWDAAMEDCVSLPDSLQVWGFAPPLTSGNLL